uniref:Uncharacterized protein n=1 Tax=Amphimedon queenslandica TaxID=400682 RepID=A0A1X7T1U0_AMPQE
MDKIVKNEGTREDTIYEQPYKTKGYDYLIPNDILFGDLGWNGAKVYNGAVSDFKSYFDLGQSINTPAAENRTTGDMVIPMVFNDVASIRDAIDVCRGQMLGDSGQEGNKIKTPKKVREIYTLLVETNMIGNIGPILPDSTLRLVSGPKKIWQDEFRFIIHNLMEEIQNSPVYHHQHFITNVVNRL